MGTVANTTPFVEGGEAPAVSRGGKKYRKFFGTVTGSSSYATGGETLGGLPTGVGTLQAVTVHNGHDGTRMWFWNGNTSTPKLIAYDAFATEEGSTTNVSTAVLSVELTYVQ